MSNEIKAFIRHPSDLHRGKLKQKTISTYLINFEQEKCMQNNINNETKTELKEGALYKCQQGELQELKPDIDQSMKKVYITETTFFDIIELRKKLRQHLNGLSPEISEICTALLSYSANDETAIEIIKHYYIKKLETLKP